MMILQRTLLGLLLLSSTISTAQDEVEITPAPVIPTQTPGFFMDLNAGVRIGGNNSSENYTLDQTNTHFAGALGYMINDQFGISLGYGMDQFKSTQIANPVFLSNTIVHRVSVEAVYDFANGLGFGSDKFSFNVHAGGGFTSIANKQYRSLNRTFSDPGVKGNDDGFNALAGLTPQIRLDEGIYLNLDFSYVMIFQQSSVIETISREEYSGTAGYMTLGAGISLKF